MLWLVTGTLLSSVDVSVTVNGTWDTTSNDVFVASGGSATGSLSTDYYIRGPAIRVALDTTLSSPIMVPLVRLSVN